ncbi:MAG: RNA polymerase sigma factor [Solirubrobacteraceae bacterium]
MDPRAPTDLELLAATRSGRGSAYGQFYERYHAVVLAYLQRRTRHRETAADLAGEVFARALLAVHRDKGPKEEPAAPWLLTVTRNVLIDSVRRGTVEAAARRSLHMEQLSVTDDDLDRLDALTEDLDRVVGLLEQLPVAQREALKARIIDEREYADIAGDLHCSDFVVRQRVSRGLKTLRSHLEAGQ